MQSCRPQTTANKTRSLLEADAILGIIALCESNAVDLVSSEVLLFEIEQSPNITRRAYAVQVLYREIGIVNTVRFINQFTVGYGDYTQEREKLFERMTMDDIVAEIKRKSGQRPPREG